MNKQLILSPSALSCDFSHLGDDVRRAEEAGVEYLHLDVMDGVFVPNISFGPCVISSLRGASGLVFDVHLMITDPIRYIPQFIKAGADIITIHVEATDDPAAALRAIRDAGVRCCISIKPATPTETILPYLSMLDMVLVMSVEPGFGGQKFLDNQMAKVRRLRDEITRRGLKTKIQVDGGVSPKTAHIVAEAGADVLVAGSAVYGAENPAEAIDSIREKAEAAFKA